MPLILKRWAPGDPITSAALNQDDDFLNYKQNVMAWGAVGDGATDDSGPIAAAASGAGGAVYYSRPTNPGYSSNIYSSTGTNYTNAMGPRWMAGISGSPVQSALPVMVIQKHSSSDRSTVAKEWDQGALYAALIKESGDAFGAAITGVARHQSSGNGQLIGVHGRGMAYTATAQVWGGWSYGFAPDLGSGAVGASIIGHEINIVNRGNDQGWQVGGLTGQSRGLVAVTADSSNPVTHMIYVGRNSAAPNGFIHTGLLFGSEGIMPSDAAISNASVANNEAIRLEGATSSATAYTGIRFRSGTFRTGIAMTESVFTNNAAILLADDHRIVVGAGPGKSTYLAMNSTTALANFQNMAIQINATQVVGPRKTGWVSPTGTATRATFATSTVTLPTLAGFVMAMYQDLAQHGLLGT